MMKKSKLPAVRKPDNVPAVPTGGLARFLYGPTAVPASKLAPVTAMPTVPQARARLDFAFDATASREHAWSMATELTDALLTALPDRLDVRLMVHGGGKVHTVTRFESDARRLRDRAAGIRCKAGYTRFLDILNYTLQAVGVSVVVYIGDSFEENEAHGRQLADALRARGTRLIILHDTCSRTFSGTEIFAEMAARTGGAVLPFDASALPRLKELLQAVAVLAVGDVPLLEARRDTMPGARLLLEHLSKKGG